MKKSDDMKKKGQEKKYFIILHILLFFYSWVAVFSKWASAQAFGSIKFWGLYGCALFVMFIYAIAWQQVLKKISLFTAYASKSVSVIWGLVWGYFLFNEKITLKSIVGAIVIMVGIYFVISDTEGEK